MKGAVLMGKPFIALVYVAAALLAVAYLMPVVQIFQKRNCGGRNRSNYERCEGNSQSNCRRRRGSAWGQQKHALAMGIPMVMTLLLAVILGTAPNFGPHLYQMAQVAAEAVMKGG